MYAALRQAGDDDRRRCGALEPRRRRDCVPRRESRRVRARVARVRRGGAGLRACPAIRKRAEEWEALCSQRSSAWRLSRRCSPPPAGQPTTARPPSSDARGFTPLRYFQRMRVELADAGAPTAAALRAFVPGEDDDAVFAAYSASFADHWGGFEEDEHGGGARIAMPRTPATTPRCGSSRKRRERSSAS